MSCLYTAYFHWYIFTSRGKKVQHCYIMAFARIFFSIFSPQIYRSKTSLWRCMQYCLFLLRFVHKIKPWFKWVARENMCEYINPFILDKALCLVLSIAKNHVDLKRYFTRILLLCSLTLTCVLFRTINSAIHRAAARAIHCFYLV